LLRHSPVHFHFTLTYASGINLVERFFGSLTENPSSVAHDGRAEMPSAILPYVDAQNDCATPFKWVKTTDEILDNIRRFGSRVQPVQSR
jgi:hypothetical protein